MSRCDGDALAVAGHIAYGGGDDSSAGGDAPEFFTGFRIEREEKFLLAAEDNASGRAQ